MIGNVSYDFILMHMHMHIYICICMYLGFKKMFVLSFHVVEWWVLDFYVCVFFVNFKTSISFSFVVKY